MKTKTKIAESGKRLRAAEKAVEKAKAAHRAAFRKALAALFNEYGLYLDVTGSEGARMCMEELLYGRQYPIGNLPE